MRRVNPWLLPLTAAAAALLEASMPAPAGACTTPEPMLLPIGMLSGEEGAPLWPVGTGGAILVRDTGVVGASITVKDASGADVPVRFDRLSQVPMDRGYTLLRVVPDPPLPPGEYLLQTFYYVPWVPMQTQEGKQHTYPFTVRGEVGDAPDVALEFEAAPGTYADGKEFACQPIQTSCGPQTPIPARTQRKHNVAVLARGAALPAEDRGQYLFRIVSTDPSAPAGAAEPWMTSEQPDAPVFLVTAAHTEPREEYCVEVQALRVRDLEVLSLGTRCVKYTLRTEPDPAEFAPCQADPSAYARAWCTDNQTACSADNPRADEETVRTPCQHYAEICSPFIGNRSPRDQLECRMP